MCSNYRTVKEKKKHFLPLFSYITLSLSLFGFTISILAVYSFVLSFFGIRMTSGAQEVGIP